MSADEKNQTSSESDGGRGAFMGLGSASGPQEGSEEPRHDGGPPEQSAGQHQRAVWRSPALTNGFRVVCDVFVAPAKALRTKGAEQSFAHEPRQWNKARPK